MADETTAQRGDHIGIRDISHSDTIAVGRGAMAIKGNPTIYQGPAYPRPTYRADVADLIAFYMPSFVGRAHERQAIADLAGREQPGYLLVEAEAGYGKSALVAQLVHLHETSRWQQAPAPRLLYFFIREQGQRHTPMAFLQALNAQLLTLLDVPGGVPSDLWALRAQCSELWARAVAAPRAESPLLLVVDGLDEMQQGETIIAHLLPAHLGPFVHVVVTSRPSPDALQQVSVEHPLRVATVLPLHRFTEPDIVALLEKQNMDSAQAVKLAPRVLALTRGEPLFARFVAQDVAADQQALTGLEQHPPAGVDDYFRQQFQALEARAETKDAWDLLGVLTVSVGGMTIDEMADALGLASYAARRALDPIRRFLLGTERLEVMHAQLRRVLTTRFSVSEQHAYREKLLAWCQRYEAQNWPDQTPEYIFRYYPQHLRDAGQADALYRLISKRWLDETRRRFGSYAVFASHLSLAIETAGGGRPGDVLEEMRCCLVGAAIRSVSGVAPPELLGTLVTLGQLERAREIARLSAYPGRQCQAYQAIAGALLLQGCSEEAVQDVRAAMYAFDRIADDRHRESALNVLPLQSAELGMATDLHRMLTWARELRDSQDRRSVLKKMVPALAIIGDTQAMHEAAQLSGLDISDTVAIQDAIQHGLAMGAVSAALGMARLIGDPYSLVEVSLAIARSGDVTKAKEVLRDVVDRQWQVKAYAAIARILLAAERQADAMIVTEQARPIAEELEDPRERSWAILDVADVLISMNENRHARALVKKIPDPAVRARGFLKLALAAQLGGHPTHARRLFATARSVAEELDEMAPSRKWTMAAIAEYMARMGDLQALATVEAIANDDLSKARIFSMLASAFLEAPDEHAAQEVATRAIAILTTHRDGAYLGEDLENALSVLLQTNQADRVLTILANMPDDFLRSWLLNPLGEALIQAGALDRATEIAQSATNPYHRKIAREGIVRALIRTSKGEDLIALAQHIPNSPEDVEILNMIVLGLHELGQHDAAGRVIDRAIQIAEGDALALASRLEYDPSADPVMSALADIAEALSTTGQQAAAAQVAKRIATRAEPAVDSAARAQRLAMAARSLSRAGEATQAVTAASMAVADATAADSESLSGIIGEHIAVLLAQGGFLNEGIRVAAMISHEPAKLFTFARLVDAVATTGTSEQVLAAATAASEAMREPHSVDRALPLALVTWSMYRAGENAEAERFEEQALNIAGGNASALRFLATARAYIDDLTRAEALVNMAQGQPAQDEVRAGYAIGAAHSGHIEIALTAAEAIDQPLWRGSALQMIADMAVTRGLRLSASLVDQLVAAAASLPFELHRLWIQSLGVRLHVLSNRHLEASRVVREIDQQLAHVPVLARPVGLAAAICAWTAAGETQYAQAITQRWIAEIEQYTGAQPDLSDHLRAVQLLIQSGPADLAIIVWRACLRAAQGAGWRAMLEVLGIGAPLIAGLGNEAAPLRVAGEILEVESWLHPERPVSRSC